MHIAKFGASQMSENWDKIYIKFSQIQNTQVTRFQVTDVFCGRGTIKNDSDEPSFYNSNFIFTFSRYILVITIANSKNI